MPDPLRQLPLRLAAPIVIVSAALVTAACAGPGPGESPTRESHPATLVGSSWQAIGDGGFPAGQPVPTMAFGPDQISGTTGCNSYGGSYRYAGGRIEIGEIVATRIGCAAPIARTEEQFLGVLRGARSVSIDPDGHLVIDGANGSMTFDVAPVVVEG